MAALQAPIAVAKAVKEQLCRDCGAEAASDGFCAPCRRVRRKEWRSTLTLRPTKEFPGVDIDRVHETWKKGRKNGLG